MGNIITCSMTNKKTIINIEMKKIEKYLNEKLYKK